MAFEKGTATNYLDLLSKIVTFASSNGWTVLEQASNQAYMRGAGLAGLDEIYVGIRAYEVTDNTRYNFELYGSWGYSAGKAFNDQPFASGPLSTLYPMVYLWNNGIPYWLSVNGRRIICVAKVGTVYQHFYLGLINPPATDMQYPYPLLIGGMGGDVNSNYSSTTNVSAYWSGEPQYGGNLVLPGGGCGRLTTEGSSPTVPSLRTWSPVHAQSGKIISAPDGSYALYPIYVINPVRNENYGQIDGIFKISGYNNASENTLTIDGTEYTVFQNLSRTGYGDFCAMRNN